MNREKIVLKPFINKYGIITEDWGEGDYPFEYIEEKTISYDSEKKYTENELIFKRVKDGKFFKFIYSNWGQGNYDMNEQVATEVFPYTETITKYK